MAEIPTQRTPPDMTAWDLVTQAQAGDRDAFGQLYQLYQDAVFRFVISRVQDWALAEDLTSDTFLRALRRISSVSYQGRDVGAWFVTIARNLVLDHVKSSRYQRETTTAEILDATTVPGPESLVITELTATVLRHAVAQLSPLSRDAVALRYLHGLPILETAEALGCGEIALKSRVHRGLRSLAAMPEVQAVAG